MDTQVDNDLKEAVKLLEKLVRISFDKGWKVHSVVGSKYGELFVAKELWKHELIFGDKRAEVKDIPQPRSSDIILYKTKRKIEVKWSMLRYRDNDYYYRERGNVPHWGWGFSSGKQFLDKKFDYCVLLAASKDGAFPKYIFVLKQQEMKNGMEERVSGEGGKSSKSYFLETSDDDNFFDRRSKANRFPIKPLEIENFLLDRSLHKRRWEELKQNGLLED